MSGDARLERCAQLIQALEQELHRCGLWEPQPPSAWALQSAMPFSADRMRFTQWLQWIFIPRTRALLDQGGPLPQSSAIQPMAEEMLKDVVQDTDALTELLGEFDNLIEGR